MDFSWYGEVDWDWDFYGVWGKLWCCVVWDCVCIVWFFLLRFWYFRMVLDIGERCGCCFFVGVVLLYYYRFGLLWVWFWGWFWWVDECWNLGCCCIWFVFEYFVCLWIGFVFWDCMRWVWFCWSLSCYECFIFRMIVLSCWVGLWMKCWFFFVGFGYCWYISVGDFLVLFWCVEFLFFIFCWFGLFIDCVVWWCGCWYLWF